MSVAVLGGMTAMKHVCWLYAFLYLIPMSPLFASAEVTDEPSFWSMFVSRFQLSPLLKSPP